MSHTNKSYELEQQILTTVHSISDPQPMLLEIAQTLGESFKADICIVKASRGSKAIIWSSSSSSLNLDLLEENLMTEKEFEELRNSLTPKITQINPESPSESGINMALGMSTAFRDVPNGLLILGRQSLKKWTVNDKNRLTNLVNVLGTALYFAQDEYSSSETDFQGDAEEKLNQLTRLFPSQGSPIIKQLYELMRQQLAQQRQLNEFKDNIITAISDKARNPLASMRMAFTMLKEDNLPPDAKQRYVGILEDEWQQLNILINNIVTLKQLESHELTVTVQPSSIMPFIEQTAIPLSEKWQQDRRKPINLEMIANSPPQTFYTDPKHLQSILEELLINARNYADPNTTVKLTIEQPQTSNKEELMILLENQGAEIKPEETERIFELFYRGEDALARSVPGTGIGLALVKGLVELLKGKITITNQANDNSFLTTVTLILPSLTT